MEIATWNVNSVKVRLPQLVEWFDTQKIEVVGLQELKCETEQFPYDAFEDKGYFCAVNGQKSYNGVALISRSEITDIVHDIPNFPTDEKRVIAGTIQGIRVINLYVVNGQNPESPKYEYKLAWLDAVKNYIKEEMEKYPQLIILGDFNIAPRDEDVHDPQAWKNRILCTDKEREVFDEFLQLGLADGLRMFATPWGDFTWWDYRNQGFEKNQGLRIDHLLLSLEASSRVESTRIYTDVRAHERPSDHAPVSVVLC